MKKLDIPPPNPSGLCQCGCGEETAIAKQGSTIKGWVRGEHKRFLSGHHWRVTPREFHPAWKGGRTVSNGYLVIHLPNHPRADASGYIREHIVLAENALGKKLPAGATIHHVNEEKNDNSRGNLVLCQNQSYHIRLHKRLRAFRACGNANWSRCVRCKQYDNPKNMARHSRGCRTHRSCALEYKGGGNGYRRGSDSPNAKLTESDVLQIRKLYSAGGISQLRIAGRYGVSESAIFAVLSGRTWGHVR